MRTQEKLTADLRVTNEKLDNLARTDQLTGLSNRRDIMSIMQLGKNCCERSRKTMTIALWM